MEKLKNLMVSRRFIVALSGVLLVISNDYDVQISTEALQGLVGLAMAWIIGDSMRKT